LTGKATSRNNQQKETNVAKKGAGKPGWRMSDRITAGPVDDYIYSLVPKRPEVLAEMEQYAGQHNVPIVGPAVARILQQLALTIAARNIFELGSAIGYSTIWWAQAVGDKGRVIYTDGDRRNAERARGYFDRAGVAGRIQVHVGDALEFLSEQTQEFDVIFNDVDKEDYPRVLRLVSKRLRKGGLFITDNVLWSGRVTEKTPKEASTKAIVEFNRLLSASPDFYSTILPIRDGIAVALKK
jgi:caffeoyl-CoA O-methyltransferase